MISGALTELRPWRRLSVEELAALAEVPSRRVWQELEEGILPGRAKGRTRHSFGPRDVFYLRLVRHLERALTLNQSARRELHEAISRVHDDRKSHPSSWRKTDTGWEFTSVQASFDARQPFAESVKKVRLFIHGKRRIESRPDILGGEPVFKGTRIAVRHVGDLLLKGVPRAEVREDFPRLDDEDLTFAALFAQLPRPPGRPRKSLVSRREGA
ncbi:DUF433 domain-containing protein [Corallococcus sp. AS-1-6]|uniref:DUF433 domain-containing protein n=1 Tax=Corallococcus sp. AS-1-6 TaxID=2874599 RepID=UPI001CC0E9D5|nr:DUF433 domain-containing protein [Corallococcus sp. AS-1-6]MBZ4375369.1 DUF433 domain-containing protein [Corallococcus sp. AS-1-6]